MSDTLQQVFRETLHQPLLTLQPTDAMNELQGWDSLAHVALILAIERTFDISFTAEEMLSMRTVKMIEATLAKHGALHD